MALSIVHVSPYPWEDGHEVSEHVLGLGRALAARGHRVIAAAPSRSQELVARTRAHIEAGTVWPDGPGLELHGVGELLPFATSRRGTASLPIDIARTVEALLLCADGDLVHVHEPFAPSASSVALRHSRALNVGTFHAPMERVLSTQVARRFVELFFGRLDARIASFAATGQLMQQAFGGEYDVIGPGAEVVPRAAGGGPVRIAFCDQEERPALRLFLRALRRLPAELDWEAHIHAPTRTVPSLRPELRQRVHVATDGEAAVLARADVVVGCSLGAAPAPGLLVRALAAGAVPLASRLPAYEEVVRDGERGLLFEPGDFDVLVAQLERLVRDEPLRARLGGAAREDLSFARTAAEVEAVYARVLARRHRPRTDPALRARLAARPLIDVDLHMHTDHSHDCATPVDVLLATAREQGLGAIAVTDHNEVSGAFEAAAKAAAYGVKVIVGEEIKTASQGEVIGLFLTEKIPRGLTLEATIAEIRRQGGLVYVPHPFDRLHSVPDYEHLLAVVDDLDAIEVFNPRIALHAFNEEAERFAGKYRIVAGAGSDSHVAQGLGSVRIRMHDFDGPHEFLAALADAEILGRPSPLGYVGVQALKFWETRATPPGARRAVRERRVRRAVGTRKG